MAPQLFKKEFDEGIDIRPTISATKAHIKMPELDEAVRAGRIQIDGKIVQRSTRLPGMPVDSDPGVEATVSKVAVEPVWYLPGIAERLGISGEFGRAKDRGGQDLLTKLLFLFPQRESFVELCLKTREECILNFSRDTI